MLAGALGDDEVTWGVFSAYPTKYEAGSLAAQSDDVLIETLELGVEFIPRER